MPENNDMLIAGDEQLPLPVWRELVKHRSDHCCEQCGDDYSEVRKRGERTLHAHHIDRNNSNNCLANGVALCGSCHAALHAHHDIEERVARFKDRAWKSTPESAKKGWETRRARYGPSGIGKSSKDQEVIASA